MTHFTGSTAVGRQIAQTAGGLLKKVSLELGAPAQTLPAFSKLAWLSGAYMIQT